MSKEVTGDIENITEITDYLMEALDLYLSQSSKEYSTTDVFMAAHNFHKMVALSVAKKLAPEIPVKDTLWRADLTFRRAIRELRLPSR